MGWFKKKKLPQVNPLWLRIEAHFLPAALSGLVVTERKFPKRMRADVQRGVEEVFSGEVVNHYFTGVETERYSKGMSLSGVPNNKDELMAAAPLYEDVNVGEEAPVSCLTTGLWLGEVAGVKFALLLDKEEERVFAGGGVRLQIAVAKGDGTAVVGRIFGVLEKAVRDSRSYRGKVLSLDVGQGYRGQAEGIQVHKLRTVRREDVILPRATLELLERNVLRFVERRERLGTYGQSRKKGLLFYGPPGTGKTHTIHYLAGALPGHTTLLISGEQVGLLSEYMTLARLLQPSMVVIEDADLIARQRAAMQNVIEEVLLNKLLNEMDGLKEDADVMFVLTTNRPEVLEAALTARPGRVDQAIEFPLPDEEGRAKLVRLYGRGAGVSDALVEEVVKRTGKVSGAFIKELMRRAVQVHMERVPGGEKQGELVLGDVQEALEEMLFKGGALNAKLLGGVTGEG